VKRSESKTDASAADDARPPRSFSARVASASAIAILLLALAVFLWY
jgi:hypothetical protein